MSVGKDARPVDDPHWSETQLPAAFFEALPESPAAEPTLALVHAARRMRALVQRS